MALYLLPTIPLIFWLNRPHGLNNYKFEVLVLAVWPVGWLIGTLVAAGLRSAPSLFYGN